MFENCLVFPLMTFAGPLQPCLEDGHTQVAGELRPSPALRSPVSGCRCLKTELGEAERELGQLPLLR